MNRLFKVLILLFCSLFIFYGCKKDKDDATDIDPGNVTIRDNIRVEDLGLVNDYSVLKITNDNYTDVAVKISIGLIDIGKDNEYIKYIQSNSIDYLVFKNKNNDRFLYDFYIINEKDKKYFELINSINITYADSGNELVLNIDNNYNKDVTLEVLVLFFSDNKLVDLNTMLVPKVNKNNIKNVTINKSKEKYDRVEIKTYSIKSK